MASSNRHWPSMFKSKPCNTHHHHNQWQHELNSASLISTGALHRTPYATGGSGCEERSPEPKPRWNPKPEQIRILEAIFNSGMVNPPRDEIRKIRAQLQEYGQVGDANVFYWFQNRKSRSKHKLRHLQNSPKQQQNNYQQQQQTSPITTSIISLTTPPSSSSSSSEKSSPKGSKRKSTLSLTSPSAVRDASINSPTGSVNQTTFFQPNSEFVSEPFFFPIQQQQGGGGGFSTQGFYFSELSNVVVQGGQDHTTTTVGPCTSLLLSEMMNISATAAVTATTASSKNEHQGERSIKTQPHFTCSTIGLAPPFAPSADHHTTCVTVPSSLNPIQDDTVVLSERRYDCAVGVGESSPVESGGPARSTVFVNDVAFDVSVGPFNVREAFGDDVALVHSSGQPVLTNEWGVTLHPLQHGSCYYLLPLSMSETYLKWGS